MIEMQRLSSQCYKHLTVYLPLVRNAPNCQMAL